MLLSKTFRASWSIGLAAALLAAVPPGPIARAENIVGDGGLAAHLLDAAASEAATGRSGVMPNCGLGGCPPPGRCACRGWARYLLTAISVIGMDIYAVEHKIVSQWSP